MQNSKLYLLAVAIILLLGIGAYLLNTESQSLTETQQVSELATSPSEDSGTTMEVQSDTEVVTQPQNTVQYAEYSESAVNEAIAEGKTIVLFFHASWCPTCIAADIDITENLSSLPNNLVVLKVDYDSATELKKQYNVTYQHTFVQLDDQLNEVQSWNGGETSELIKKINTQ